MAYLIDRQQARRVAEVVMILAVARPRARSCMLLRDGSRHFTLTRPSSFARWLRASGAMLGLGMEAKQE
jgi:hypothetical protein